MSAPAWYRWDGDTLIIHLHVQPRASQDQVAGLHGGALKVCLTAPPVGGKANAHLIRYLARLFGVKPSRIRLLRGDTARRKTLAIASPAVPPDSLIPRHEEDL